MSEHSLLNNSSIKIIKINLKILVTHLNVTLIKYYNIDRNPASNTKIKYQIIWTNSINIT